MNQKLKNLCTLPRNIFAKTDYNKSQGMSKNVKVQTEIRLILPEKLVQLLILMPDIDTCKLKCINCIVKGDRELEFNFINILFHETFKYRKKTQ